MSSHKPFTPEEWGLEIQSGLDYRRKFGIEGAWGDLEAMYYNVHASMANDGPNIIMSTMDALLSTLTVPTPAIMVKPEHPEAVNKAPIVEVVDNVLLRELKLRDEVDTAALHAGLFGVGILKAGFDSQFGYDPRYDLGGSLRLGFTLTQFGKEGDRRIETDSTVSPGMPWVKAVDPRDIIVPWGTFRLNSTPWICHRFVRHIDDLKADPKYENTDRVTPSLSMENFVQSYSSTMRIFRSGGSTDPDVGRPRRMTHTKRGSRDIAYVELFEIQDRRTGRIMVIVSDYEDFLRNDINALQIDNVLPYASVSFTPKARSFWTTSDAYYLQAIQMEISDLAVQRTKIRRLAVLKFLYDGDVLEEAELEKLLSPDVAAAAKINAGTDIQKAIFPLQSHPDQTLILEEEHLRKNSREQIGFSRNQLGEFSGGRRTATEASIVKGASDLRMSRRGLAIKTLYEDVIGIINGIIFEHWTMTRYVEVIGQQYAEQWQRFSGTSLKSRYSYNVNFVDDAQLRARRIEALQLYQLMIQDPAVDPAGLRLYLSDAFNDPQFARVFNADIQNAMQGLRLQAGILDPTSVNSGGAGGAGRQGGGQTGGASVPGLQNPNGQGAGAGSSPQGQLASGRFGN